MIFPLFAVLVPALALADSPSTHLIVTTSNNVQTGAQSRQTLSDSILISSTVEPNGLTKCHCAPATPLPCLLPAEEHKGKEGKKGASTVLVKTVTIEDNRDQTQVILEQPEPSAAQWNLSSALGFQYPDIPVAWNLRDVLLYAVSIGAQTANQSLVNDPNFTVFPSYAACLSFKGTSEGWVNFTSGRYNGPIPGFPDLTRFPPVQDFQYIEPYLPLPNNSGAVPWTIKKKIISVEEHVSPSGSNLIIENELTLFDPNGVKYTRLIAATKYLGGSANGFNYSERVAIGIEPKPVPSRAPNHQIRITVSPTETLVYRLNGDYNALHVDPEVGIKYGYGELPLHALSYFGFSAFELVGHLGGGDVSSLHSMQGAFGLPVSPGDELVLKAWEVGNGPDGTKEITYVVEDLTKNYTVLDRAAAYIRRK
ncbi:uncharacterized protein EI90DRAFT_3127954 [Cantharellus anzutake]|uniref:uncharacterized protein n=1 Tax=Cantharellus anzutake TaxID=1750568 RepID=UPI001902F3D2|nr:uncharacterized protein EI90DRAFT_3127954 [Cantharellus anzutake]KAF8326362.1 hypothetical protein EI90DRAFT_3127954 [Cantharellus anzutake]